MSRTITDPGETHGLSTSDVPTTWLSTLRVLSVGDTTAVTTASAILRAFGANVTVVSALGLEEQNQVQSHDVVLVDRIESVPGLTGSRNDVTGYLHSVEKLNRAVWVTASAFGLESERADALGSDFVALAAGGVLGHSREGAGTPTVPAGEIALKLVGVTVAVSALHGVHEFRDTARPVHVDVSAQGAVVASGLCLELAHALGRCPDEGGSSRYGAPTGFFHCKEGQFYIVVLEQHQWEALQRTLSPALDDLVSIEDGRRFPERVNSALEEWASTRSNLECESILQDAGVPCTAVNSVEEYLERAQAIGRPLDQASVSASMPAIVSTEEKRSPIVAGRSLSELRVLDAGHVLAVPLATAWLGAMGAQVTKLEDAARLDVYRRRGPFLDGEPGLNRSAYFNQVNYCKRPLDVTVNATGSSLDLEPFDVVVHNVSPRRAKALGVDGETVASKDRPRLSLSSSGFGGTGDWAGYRAYGHNIHAFAGLVSATQDAAGQMADVGTPWADPLTGAVAATWILAWSLADEHHAVTSVDLSMTEVMASQLIDLVGVDPDRYYDAPDSGSDVFVRFGDDLIAVSLRTTEHATAFKNMTGKATPTGLRRGAELIAADLGLDPSLRANDFAELLREQGVPAALVEDAHSLANDAFLRSTGILQRVESPTLGGYEVTGLPWNMIGQKRAPLTAAPELN
ncbi:CoA transferase [Arthrobacter sp. M4]|uniref:CoA transferase n=1 Tax=Arthrobacter sp. M4 TaxID=218160 RepID=UPI001CDD58DF|nr:CoA transferase [Arthrobacter sp. M4]MCA4135374.1 CoA transferase [Arthrobacter sp. M4]